MNEAIPVEVLNRFCPAEQLGELERQWNSFRYEEWKRDRDSETAWLASGIRLSDDSVLQNIRSLSTCEVAVTAERSQTPDELRFKQWLL